jgi:tetratricopeptide (TPR) repeat protein
MQEAEASVREGLALMPDDPYLLAVLGEVLRNSGRPAEAIEAFTREAEIMPWAPRPWIDIGVLEHIAGNYEASVEALERARALDQGWFAQLGFEREVLEASREGRPYQR